MRRSDHDVLGRVDELSFLLGVAAPQKKHDRIGSGVDGFQHGIGEGLPALAGVRCRHTASHREHGVQEQHAPIRPRQQMAVIRRRNAEVIRQFLVNVPQRRGQLHSGSHAEGQAVPLSRRRVRVLAKQHDAETGPRGRGEGVVDVRHRWEDRLRFALDRNEIRELSEVWLQKLPADHRSPIGREAGGTWKRRVVAAGFESGEQVALGYIRPLFCGHRLLLPAVSFARMQLGSMIAA